MAKPVEILVYGVEQPCPACFHQPSSIDTFEWLKEALARKYPGQRFQMEYIDIFHPPDEPERRSMARRILEEEFFYPLVVIEGKIVSEGNPRLKTIYRELEKYGFRTGGKMGDPGQQGNSPDNING
jgi:Protein of unknown function (DUF1462).